MKPVGGPQGPDMEHKKIEGRAKVYIATYLLLLCSLSLISFTYCYLSIIIMQLMVDSKVYIATYSLLLYSLSLISFPKNDSENQLVLLNYFHMSKMTPT